ncbi:NUDIX hydrolase [Gordonia sp. C13]|uniref:NUDIX hydrolase n=1 Tax=Gordonia sp. C13 TaxID=2935078 RepID=UPI002009E653|nr:NUDIX domain-containing protein [Gordonia sp. C13]MCK8615785.1 NUDIX domain-containing protein [Gordonia sp. C13]
MGCVVDSAVIRVSAVVLRDSAGAVLTVRKRGTARFMFPGGKPEPGETALQTAIRECREELHLELDPSELQSRGVYRAVAANEDGFDVEAEVFVSTTVLDRDARTLSPAAEIAELRWQPLDGSAFPPDLAPLTECVLPELV